MSKTSKIVMIFYNLLRLLQQFKMISTETLSKFNEIIEFMLGMNQKETYQKLSPYYFGITHINFTLINLKYTTTSLKLSTQFLIKRNFYTKIELCLF